MKHKADWIPVPAVPHVADVHVCAPRGCMRLDATPALSEGWRDMPLSVLVCYPATRRMVVSVAYPGTLPGREGARPVVVITKNLARKLGLDTEQIDLCTEARTLQIYRADSPDVPAAFRLR